MQLAAVVASRADYPEIGKARLQLAAALSRACAPPREGSCVGAAFGTNLR